MKKLRRGGKRHRIAKRLLNRQYRGGHPRGAKSSSISPPSIKKPQEFRLPTTLSISSNLDNTVARLMEFREGIKKGKRFNLVFDDIREIDAAAALVLAAEIDIWRRSLSARSKLRSRDKSWYPEIRKMLYDMGLFELLSLPTQSQVQNTPAGDLIFLKFISGIKVDLSEYTVLRERMEQSMHCDIPNKMLLFTGIAEAVTNSFHHAYEDKSSPLSRWWASASFSRKSGELKILCYDRGITIASDSPELQCLGKGFRLSEKSGIVYEN